MTILHCFSHIADMRNFPPMRNLAQIMALSAVAAKDEAVFPFVQVGGVVL